MSAKKKTAGARKVEAALVDAGASAVVGFFTESVVWAVSKQCSLRLTAGAPVEHAEKWGLVATVEFSGPSAAGTLSLRFPENVYLFIMWRTMRERFDCVTPELADGINEMTNIVFGNARALLESHGIHVARTGPAVARASTVKSKHEACIPFRCEAGSFYMELKLTVVPGAR